jgi:type II secretory pathway component PulM
MPERISPKHPRRAEILLIIMAGGVLFLTGVVVWAIIAGDPGEERINSNVEKLAIDMERAQDANACTAYQNHRAIEQALRDIARLNGIRSGDPRVLPSDETIRACDSVGISIDDQGVPEIGEPAH